MDEVKTGVVKWYSPEKKYGFFTMDNKGGDVFVHSSDLNGMDIMTGDRVSFKLAKAQKGFKAVDIEKL